MVDGDRYDLLTTGLSTPVAGTVSLPFDADMAISIEDADTAFLWTVSNTTWISESFVSPAWPLIRQFAHDTTLGGTEIELMPQTYCGCTEGTAGFAHHRLVAFALDAGGAVQSAFPTINALDGDFDYYYEWLIVDSYWDLLDLPSAAQEPYLTLALDSQPPSQDTLSTDETVQYLVEVTNAEDESVDGVMLWLTASSGLSYQSADGATCNDCSAPDEWLLDLPTIASGETQLVTVTALLATVITGRV